MEVSIGATGQVSAATLRWADGPGLLEATYDLIVGSDIVYDLANQSELLQTVEQFATPDTECCLALNLRGGGAFLVDFLVLLEKFEFSCEMEIAEAKANSESKEANSVALLCIHKQTQEINKQDNS